MIFSNFHLLCKSTKAACDNVDIASGFAILSG